MRPPSPPAAKVWPPLLWRTRPNRPLLSGAQVLQPLTVEAVAGVVFVVAEAVALPAAGASASAKVVNRMGRPRANRPRRMRFMATPFEGFLDKPCREESTRRSSAPPEFAAESGQLLQASCAVGGLGKA